MTTKQITSRLDKLSESNEYRHIITWDDNRIRFNSTDLRSKEFEDYIPCEEWFIFKDIFGYDNRDNRDKYEEFVRDKIKGINIQLADVFLKTRKFVQIKMREVVNFISDQVEKAKQEKDAMV